MNQAENSQDSSEKSPLASSFLEMAEKNESRIPFCNYLMWQALIVSLPKSLSLLVKIICIFECQRKRKRAQRLLHLWKFDSTTQTFCSNYWRLECHLERERLLHLWNCGRPAPHKPRVGGTRGMWARFSAPPCKLTCHFLLLLLLSKWDLVLRRHRNNCKWYPLLSTGMVTPFIFRIMMCEDSDILTS